MFTENEITFKTIVDDNDDIFFAHQKLTLILDLDETLIHTVTVSDVKQIGELCVKENFLIAYPTSHEVMIIFIRPNLLYFLSELNNYYDIYIYTNATKEYCEMVMSAIIVRVGFNPFIKYFYRISNKSLDKTLEIDKFDKTKTVIIDDRCDIWKNDLDNLIKIRRYLWPDMSDKSSDYELNILVEILNSLHTKYLLEPINFDIRKFIAEKHKEYDNILRPVTPDIDKMIENIMTLDVIHDISNNNKYYML